MDRFFSRRLRWIAVLSVMVAAASCTPDNRPVVYQPPPPPQPVQVDPGPVGPPPAYRDRVRVPNLRGEHIREARQRLHARGLRIGRVDERPSRRSRPGTILNQQPDAGTFLRRGRHVDVLVAAERWTRVPDVRGLRLQQASLRLRDAGLEPGNVTQRNSRRTRPGHVIRQSEKPGERVRSGRTVDLVIAQANELQVPDLRGVPEQRALRILKREGLRVGKISHRRTNRFKSGDVIGHSPPPGSSVRPRTRVDLVIARPARAVPPDNVRTPNVIRTPDLYGRHIREAERIAQRLNLRVRVMGRRQGDGQIQPEQVIEQKPRKGSRVSRGTVIDVWLHEER